MPIPKLPQGEFLWLEEGMAREGCVAEVAPLIPVFQTFSFAVPAEWEPMLAVGTRVTIPMRRSGRPVPGFVVALDRRAWDSSLRPIAALIDAQSYLTPELVALAKRISQHYACPLGITLKAMTPEAVRLQRGLKRTRYVRVLRGLDAARAEGLPGKRMALFEFLSRQPEEVPLAAALKECAVGRGVARWLADNGWIEMIERRVPVEDAAAPSIPRAEPAFELNAEQRDALATIDRSIDAGQFAVTLLFGVSGSGKTEIYIRAMRRVLAAGRQAILLIPEIVLTTQLVQRLSARFDHLAVAHSGLTETQRAKMWRQIAAGQRQIIIGTRSAVFAPCPNLGLICVDEEQETSYKNLQAPRFHVRDVAILRAQALGIPVVLGSATPSLEMWYNSVSRPEYQRITLRHRVNERPLPKVQIVDMTAEWLDLKHPVVLSRLMEEGLTETFALGEQAVILMNRRGFAPGIICPNCKTRISCPNCQVSMVLHAPSRQLECHYCRHRQAIPKLCPQLGCGHPLSPVGLGTQRVEDVLRKRFPQARVRRVDSDTMHHRREYEGMVDAFSAREIDCLVGTQMIAKGLDFPFVSFVGVVDADPNALSSDFRAEERLFQLITQVAGRAGRAAVSGRVVVQTTMPDLPSLRFALHHDYQAFAERELAQRRRVELPPYRRLARLVLAHEREEKARHEAGQLTERVATAIEFLKLEGAEVMGPNPCALLRLRKHYRYDVLIHTRGAGDLHRLLHTLETDGALRMRSTSLIVDVDPVNLQ